MRLLLTLGLATLLSTVSMQAAEAKAKHHGNHVGKSSSSAEGTVAYAAAYNDVADGQTFTQTTLPLAISFPTNQPGTPKRISHPHHEDDTKFLLKLDGTYLIGWTLTFINPNSVVPTVAVQLVDATGGIIIDPAVFQTRKIDTTGFDDTQSISGQTIMHLKKGAVLQLLATSTATGVRVVSPTFFITKIAD